MTEIENNGIRILFSYKTPVAAYASGFHFKTSKYWSRTTTRHINQWLNGASAMERPQEFFDVTVLNGDLPEVK